MHSFFFGDSKQPLYGVHHAPTGSCFRQEAIIICNPVGHEYLRSHALLRNLADCLSNSGYHVLRFDYRGTGDSYGEIADFCLEDWLNDTLMAANELKAISGINNISVIGVRIGGLLALLASTRDSFSRIFLWDCVVNTRDYINNLKLMSTELLNNKSWFKSVRNQNELKNNEYIGFQYSDEFIETMRKLNPLDNTFPKHLQVHTIFSKSNAISNATSKSFTELFNDHQSVYIDDMPDWDDVMRLSNKLTGMKTIKYICEELS
jgi:esterase/lipase